MIVRCIIAILFLPVIFHSIDNSKLLYNGRIKMQGTRSFTGQLQEKVHDSLFNLFDFIILQW